MSKVAADWYLCIDKKKIESFAENSAYAFSIVSTHSFFSNNCPYEDDKFIFIQKLQSVNFGMELIDDYYLNMHDQCYTHITKIPDSTHIIIDPFENDKYVCGSNLTCEEAHNMVAYEMAKNIK